MLSLGNFLKESRKKNHLSQKAVSLQLHVSRQTVSAWENNRNCPDIETLTTLSKLYKFDLNQILQTDEQVNVQATSIKKTTAKQKTATVHSTITKVTVQKDEGLLLFLAACLSFVIAPFGIVTAPAIIRYNKKTNTFYKFIYLICGCVIIYNLFVIVAFIANSFNWGITSYH
ncbi:hypothetical protein LPAF129_18220 [Ligilactobacillus pabuli]|uniref:HTH cro/C1-type domain-containing protein n=1 Tax=Ligilactobacillus pabuli TaxID=2886039 RepID=A0ABQ5JP15_9LACO|nr:helix-turn-helix transcriptional regulator [Ligilactobacillus pabuli]GKS82136.1 hypothetical protein LPAF129_18220 [Ligilactobacillus pabuli]HIW89438.1 helix-turn-helix domain-containing protein [Candidatus Ligilactobacillus excrementipullorum]